MTTEAEYRQQQEAQKRRDMEMRRLAQHLHEDSLEDEKQLREMLKAVLATKIAEEKDASAKAYLESLEQQLDPEFDGFEAEIGEKSEPQYAKPTSAKDVQAAVNATPRWKAYMAANKGKPVTHSNPVKSDGKVVCTSGFGHREKPVEGASSHHMAADLAVLGGGKPDVAASADGVVLFAGWKRGWGWTVEVGHADGTKTRYSHLDNNQFAVSVGQEVTQGQTLGRMGNTGLNGMGVHLDYAQYDAAGKPIQPVVDGKSLKKGDRLEPCEDSVDTQQTSAPPPTKPRGAELRI